MFNIYSEFDYNTMYGNNWTPVSKDKKQVKNQVIKKNLYLKVEFDGSWCIIEPKDLTSFICSDIDYQEAEKYTITPQYMTQEEFEKLPEFDGF